ncbi:LamG-like jellyroll fold domain-containing protein [Actinoplanes sp. NPDC020271]|uniref:LamG-like jellyroll fold domain-containing protein n=1 Tax=Actinoplanes sp. NPDC020271 TaxID=3363896 RepID=UPI00378FFFB9
MIVFCGEGLPLTMSSRSTRRGRLPVFTVVAALLTTTALGAGTPAWAQIPTVPNPTTPPVAPPVQTGELEPGPAATPADNPAKPIAAAIDQAKKTGQTVPIPSLTDEFSTTSASPDGSFVTTYSVAPERVQRAGAWASIDTTLTKKADGTYEPKVAAADVSFSGGGDTTLVSLKQGSYALTFTWAEKLPTPVVSEDTATYPNVLPDVDLQVTASSTGYSSMFVIKTPEAAANPKVQQLNLGLTGTRVKLATTRDGGAEAADKTTGRTVFSANTAMMWDSTPGSPDPAEKAIRARVLSSPQATHEAADLIGKNRAKIKLGFADGKQSMTLDKSLLTAKTTKYPVFVDPEWAGYYGSQSAWARISSNGWNIYNSTLTSGFNSARIGLDDWPQYGGEGETARTYYKLNISGIKGATVKAATLNIQHRWSASCTDTNAALYATSAPAGFTSSTLNWSKQPTRGALLATQRGREVNCSTSSPAATPGTFGFDVSSNIASLATGKKDYAYFLAQAGSETNRDYWKQLGYKGGASLTVQYSYPPTLNANDGKLHVTPNNNNEGGKLVTTSKSPTLSWGASNIFPNGVKRRVLIEYQVEERATGKLIAGGYGPSPTTFNTNGSPWTVNKTLPDGDYRWRAWAKNEDGLWAAAWTPYMYFTVDTTVPNAPAVKSTQFPPAQVGAAFTDKGVFALSTDATRAVTGYLFTLDGDLTNVVYAAGKNTQWVTGTTITPGVVYYAKADNKDGTGTAVTNGSAAPVFAPGTAGPHKLVAKAVNGAGSTSGPTAYEFNAGTSTPLYVTGDQMINGYTATNTDGTTTTVPKATASTAGGVLAAQESFNGGYYFVGGYQAMLANNATTGTKVANGDSATFSFAIPQQAMWEIGANMLSTGDYGMYTLILDQGKSTQSTLITDFDAYGQPNGTVYRNLATPKDANGSPIQLDKGVHTITLKVTGKNASSLGYQASIEALRLGRIPTCAINDTKNCLNNTAISTHNTSGTPALTTADADGWGWSLDAGDLKSAGWAPGSTVNVHGATIKLPATYGDGNNDNMLAAGQLITVPASGVVNKGNAVVFAGLAVNGDVKSATGRINYAKGSACNWPSQAYSIDLAPDWVYWPTGNAVVSLESLNSSVNGYHTGSSPGIMAYSVPLVCPNAAIASISLPLVAGSIQGHVNALHILGLGIRPTSTTPDGSRWVGSWAAAQDTGAVQTTASVNATLNAQTVRIPAHLSIGAGGDSRRVRVRLANAQGKTPVTFDAASIALQDPTAGGATVADTPLHLTFNGGATSLTLPAGTEAISDPVDLPADDQTSALVSLKVKGSPTALAGHLDARSPVYVSSSDGADHTGDIDGSGFTRSTMNGIPFLAGIDVSTPSKKPAGAIVLYGDQTINSDTASNDGLSQTSDQLATAMSTDEYGQRYPVRAGVLNQGSSSWTNKAQLPQVANSQYPQNSYGLIDREILDQTDARSVLISAGSSDLLACTGTADACATSTNNKLDALAGQLQQYRPDDALDYAVDLPTPVTRTIKVYVATLPPFSHTYTAAQESARQLVNAHILGPDGPANMQGHADGVIDFAAAVSADGTATSATTNAENLTTGTDGKAYPNNLYYQRLAQQYVTDADSVDGITGDGTVSGGDTTYPIAEWKFSEGTGTTAADTGIGTGDPANPVHHPAELTNVAWTLGRKADTKAGTFNGTNSYADTKLAFNTGHSFTVAAWVRLTDKSTDRTFLARSASGYASLYLEYNKEHDLWQARMPSATSGDTAAIHMATAPSDQPPAVGVWTHLTATYDADVKRLGLYVNGESEGAADEATTFNDPETTTWIGRSTDNWFAGDISDIRIWQRALDATDVETEAHPRAATLSWQFEDPNSATATDSAANEAQAQAPGTFTPGVTLKPEGHPDPDSTTSGADADLGAITLNGTTGAVSTRARLRTDQSFTVSTWARITDTTRDQAVASQYGNHASGFQLNFGTSCKCWQFQLPTSDTTNPTITTAQASTTATANTWTYLAAVYDASTGTAKLYVNGIEAGTQTVTARTWNATGNFNAGRSLINDINTSYLAGDIDDVVTYQEALTPQEINNLWRTELPRG